MSEWGADTPGDGSDGSGGERYYELMAAAWMWDISSREALGDALAECGLERDDYDVQDDGACIAALRTVAARRLLSPLHLSEPLRTRVAVTAGYLVLEHIRRREQMAAILRGPVMAGDMPSLTPGDGGAGDRLRTPAWTPSDVGTTRRPPPASVPAPQRSWVSTPLIALALCLVALVPPLGTAVVLFRRGWAGLPEPEGHVWAAWLPVALGIGMALAGLGVFLSGWLAVRECRGRRAAADTA